MLIMKNTNNSQTFENQNTEELFFAKSDLNNHKIDKIVSESLKSADDGELYLEFSESESFVFDDQRLKSASFDTSKGFGLRAISGESSGYAHSSDITEAALRNASNTVNFITKNNAGNFNHDFSKTNRKLYMNANPIDTSNFEDKVNTLKCIDEYARKKNPNVNFLFLQVKDENEPAKALYNRLGFKTEQTFNNSEGIKYLNMTLKV